MFTISKSERIEAAVLTVFALAGTVGIAFALLSFKTLSLFVLMIN